MPIIKITKADLLKTKNVTPDWYGCQVVKVHPPDKSAKGNSVNYVFDCVVLPNQEGAGKEIPARFNSLLIGKIAPFWYACTGEMLTEETNIDMDILMGKKFDGQVVPKNFEGAIYDNFDNFLPYGSSKEAGGAF